MMNYYEGKSTLKCLGFSEPSLGLKDDETSVDGKMMDVFIKTLVLPS